MIQPAALLAASLLASSLLGAPAAHAVVLDLTQQSAVSIQTTYGTAIFTTDFTQPAGTGVLDPFLSIQNNGVEEGYNTSARGGVMDTKREPRFNHELRLADLQGSKVTINGSTFYSFLLDINEPNAGDKSQISLDALKIFASPTAAQTKGNEEQLGTKLFDLDLPSDSYLLYDDLNSGSGQADIAFFIPTSAFVGVSATDYIYMYQHFGTFKSSDFTGTTQGGFEETSLGGKIVPVPEASTVLPLGLVLGAVLGSFSFRRRRSATAA